MKTPLAWGWQTDFADTPNHPNSFDIKHGRRDLNSQPADLESAALPIELRPFNLGIASNCRTAFKTHFLRDSLCKVCRLNLGQYFINSRRSVPRISFGAR